ncbi:hypothetical protein SAMN05192589_101222 [Paracidovorax valerianellae]|uniref:Uncharacterized protein n=1 Tax=Paracidovorax valerianellae TaxID=187868 RepID=A0A1G6IPZ4_9BURK|nr:hypothetical protein [Paracidovorax valerianellae]SDC08501.1 hypothetical protein SAMN05192589_101222 [Paracidovorax valerianellae]
MHTTIDLLNRANDLMPSDAEWCRRLAISRTSLAVARVRGRLTPTVAGALAELINEDPKHWIAVAALEAAPAGHLNTHLWGLVQAGAKSFVGWKRLQRGI